MAYPALAQIDSGTIVVINFTKDKIVVAADSRSLNQETLVPDDSYCKISTFRHQLIFTSVGAASFKDRVSGAIIWDNAELARNAVRSALTKDGDIDIDAAISSFATAVKSKWDSVPRLQAMNVADENAGVLTAGGFIDTRSGMRVGVIRFDKNNLLDPIQYQIGDTSNDCWPCSQADPTERVCVAGKHFDVAENFCSEKATRPKIVVRTHLKKSTSAAKLATRIVELTIDKYETTAKDVGGKVDVVTLTKDGGVTWNALKKGCPENQN